MSNSSGTVFAGGLRQGDPGPLWDEMAGGNDTEQCASQLLDPSSIGCLSNCRLQRQGAGSTYALWSFYIIPNTADGIGSHGPTLLTHHQPPPTSAPLCKRKLIVFESRWRTVKLIVQLIPRKEGQKSTCLAWDHWELEPPPHLNFGPSWSPPH